MTNSGKTSRGDVGRVICDEGWEEGASLCQLRTCRQCIVNSVVERLTPMGYPPEMTHKMHLLDTNMYGGMPGTEVVASTLINAYRSKGSLIHMVDQLLRHIIECADKECSTSSSVSSLLQLLEEPTKKE